MPGGRETFDRIFGKRLADARPHEIEVVGYGPRSQTTSTTTSRAPFPRPRRVEQLGAFYGSEEWRQRYDGPVMELIVSYHRVVIPQMPGITQALASDA